MREPFTLKYDEAIELFEIAEDKGLILIEAITNQYQKLSWYKRQYW